MTTALLERLSHHCRILKTGNDSFWFKASTATPKPRKEKSARWPKSRTEGQFPSGSLLNENPASTLSRNRPPALTRLLYDGCLEIDNDIAGRAIRSIVVGHRNWPFAGSDFGGVRADASYFVVEASTTNGVDSQDHIADVTARIARNRPVSRWNKRMPWNWTADASQQVAQPV